jgi:hypothetical protein
MSASLDLLTTLPPAPPERDWQELALQIDLRPLPIATKGFAAPELENGYGRALELCPRVGESRQLPAVQFRLVSLYTMREQFPPLRGIAKQVFNLVHGADDPARLMLILPWQ